MQKLTESSIRQAEKLTEGKPYPEYVEQLKQIGVASYEVTVNDHGRKFYSQNGQELQLRGHMPQVRCAERFNADGVKKALKRMQDGITDYKGFLKDIADAGIHTYLADVVAMKVVYKGKSGSEVCEEAISA